MTTEDDFQRALDANPDDWQTRLVFADWLEERGDPRAEGYRALGVLRRCPDRVGTKRWFWWCGSDVLDSSDYAKLPSDWMAELGGGLSIAGHVYPRPTRREAEDAAALAFAKLPESRRKELLTVSSSA